MTVTMAQTEKILKGNQAFTQLGFSMMMTRMRGLYAKDPAGLPKYTAEINAFLAKFQSIMGADFAIISKL